jgi:hypothetical protein
MVPIENGLVLKIQAYFVISADGTKQLANI